MAYTGGGKKDPNNRLSTSDSLNTSAIWQKAIKYDPYAPEDTQQAALDEGGINDRAKGLFELARITGVSNERPPGACKKCGQVGHLAFQCRNWVKLESAPELCHKEDLEQDDPDSLSESSSDSSPKKKSKKKKSKKVKKKDKNRKEEKRRSKRKNDRSPTKIRSSRDGACDTKRARKDGGDDMHRRNSVRKKNEVLTPPPVARKSRKEPAGSRSRRRKYSSARSRRRT